MTIGEQWASYQAEIVPATAPPVQREECKRAFYAGALAMQTAIFAATEHRDEFVCQAHLAAIGHEMDDFIRLFKKREDVE